MPLRGRAKRGKRVVPEARMLLRRCLSSGALHHPLVLNEFDAALRLPVPRKLLWAQSVILQNNRQRQLVHCAEAKDLLPPAIPAAPDSAVILYQPHAASPQSRIEAPAASLKQFNLLLHCFW